MKLSRLQLILLSTLFLGYAAVSSVSELWQFLLYLCLILSSVLGLFLLEFQLSKSSLSTPTRLRSPWIVLCAGVFLMLLGLLVYLPVAETLAINQYLIEENQGSPLTDLEGQDGVGIGMMLLFCCIALPVSFLCGAIGAKCSKILKHSGIGRYSLSIALILSPLLSGAYIVFYYWLSRC